MLRGRSQLIAWMLRRYPEHLSARQVEVATYFLTGMTLAEVATKCGCSTTAVKRHLDTVVSRGQRLGKVTVARDGSTVEPFDEQSTTSAALGAIALSRRLKNG